ncbi:MAG TPA: T9SS type A sorting domain-containing protein [Ignavibacteria bacterium]|nr:T9SS type A sorting domain-containing protein [Ignavibacteria bacterium]HMQ99841.1 T9SS type A sorting domain-containing protein [Ignavibacteria bacterium]
MRTRFLFTVFSLAFLLNTAFSDTTHILFIGNSYTHVNDLPLLFKNLSVSGGRTVNTGMSAPGGYTLEGHTQLQETLDKIALRQWQYVVLQEQSQYPTIAYYRYGSMYPAAFKLDSIIRSYNSHTMFYMTWGRKYGGQQCISGNCSPVFRDYFHMQDSLASAYTEISSQLGAALAPVGSAWRRARQLDSTIALWDTDLSHPTLKGSYLAACVFYAKIFQSSPVGLSYTAGLPVNEALWLQQVAADAALGLISVNQEIPREFNLYQNYPNPFNPVTNIMFAMPFAGNAELKIYDITGKEIAAPVNAHLSAGTYSLSFDASALSSGIYIYKLTSGSFAESKKMVLIK